MKTSTAIAVSRAGRGLRVAAGLVSALVLAPAPGCAPSPGDATGRGRWGARAGAFVPGAAPEGYSPSVAVGAFYRGRIPAEFGPREAPFEIGFDVSTSESDDGRVETVFCAAHIDVLFFRGPAGQESGLYLLGGGRALLALSEVDGRSGHGGWSAALDVGLGAAPAETGWDFRFTYSSLLASDNLKDIVLLTAGYRF
ncbi:MAG: hypothetical protein ACYS9X_15295 [Planctomycetota bacterium]